MKDEWWMINTAQYWLNGELYIKTKSLNAECWTLNRGCRMVNTGCSMLKGEWYIIKAECLDAEWWMMNAK